MCTKIRWHHQLFSFSAFPRKEVPREVRILKTLISSETASWLVTQTGRNKLNFAQCKVISMFCHFQCSFSISFTPNPISSWRELNSWNEIYFPGVRLELTAPQNLMDRNSNFFQNVFQNIWHTCSNNLPHHSIPSFISSLFVLVLSRCCFCCFCLCFQFVECISHCFKKTWKTIGPCVI